MKLIKSSKKLKRKTVKSTKNLSLKSKYFKRNQGQNLKTIRKIIFFKTSKWFKNRKQKQAITTTINF